MKSWAHLPNAGYIDRILESFKSHPSQWRVACKVMSCTVWHTEWVKVRNAISTTGRDAIWLNARDTAWIILWQGNSSASDVIAPLIAYDDCAYMLDSEVGELKILAAFGDQKAILLLPACIVFNAIRELNVT